MGRELDHNFSKLSVIPPSGENTDRCISILAGNPGLGCNARYEGLRNNPLFFKMLIDFHQYDSVEKVLFIAFFVVFVFCMTEVQRQTLAHNLNKRCI